VRDNAGDPRDTDNTTRAEGAQFHQERLVPGTNVEVHEGIVCCVCNSEGDYSSACPVKKKYKSSNQNHLEEVDISSGLSDSDISSVDIQYYTVRVQHYQDQLEKNIDTDGVLIDTGLSTSVFNNAEYLMDIYEPKIGLRTISNGGHQDSKLKGIIPGMFEVWYNPMSRVNILS